MANFANIKNFMRCEFTNPDAMNQDLVNKLDQLRDQLGLPIKINSSWRDPQHNSEVGGKGNSQHLLGNAVDVEVLPGSYVYDLVALAMRVGFNGIGVKKLSGEPNGFAHLDVRPFIDRAMWSY